MAKVIKFPKENVRSNLSNEVINELLNNAKKALRERDRKVQQLKAENDIKDFELMELKMTSLWDRIFNWKF